MPSLTSDQVAQYRRDGYVLVRDLFDASVMRTARDAVDQILAAPDLSRVAECEPEDSSKARRIWSPMSKHAVFEQLATHRDLVTAITHLIGDNVVLQYSKLNVKPPLVGSVVEWHQDFAFYPHTNSDLLSCMIYLDDASAENGCLRVVPRSHEAGLVSHEIDGFFRGKIPNLAAAGFEERSIVDCAGPAGTVLFLHCLTVHASRKNTSSKPRRAFLPAYRAADALPIYYGPHAAHNEPNVRLLCGQQARVARCEAQTWRLPLAAAEFNSLYQVQEGSHVTSSGAKSATGYFAHERTS